ncbi:MAG: hypothetical protein JW889_04695 [Verrucomicrobia bacterium]|nr:hypothetical protein [Verrucomicrobiota bacterium]
MRVALLIAALTALAIAPTAWAGETTAPAADDQPKAQAQDHPDQGPPAWAEWIAKNAYDPIRRIWVPIPEGIVPGPDTGYIWNLGRWQLVTLIQRPGYGWGYYDHRGRWHGQVVDDGAVYREVIWRRRHYSDTLPRKSLEEAVLVKSIQLDSAQRARLEDLLARNIIQDLMLADAARDRNGDDKQIGQQDEASPDEGVLSYERRQGVVNVSGRAELVAKLATLITDESTYRAYASAQQPGNVVEVISLVDLKWLERAPEPALNIADLNFAGVTRFVQPRRDDYRRARKAIWFNDAFGTATVIDHPDTIAKLHAYLADMPYAPKPDRITSNAAQ